jgi:hypothetical protein
MLHIDWPHFPLCVFLLTTECSFGISVRKGKRYLCFRSKYFKTVLIPSKSVLLPSKLGYSFTFYFALNSKEQNRSWEDESRSIVQEILYLLWNPKFSRCSQMSVILSWAMWIHLNIIFQMVSIPFRFSDQSLAQNSHLHACCKSCPSHPVWFDHPNRI